MKKLLTVLLVVVLAFSCLFALTACGSEEKEGHYMYENGWTAGAFYGAKVKVTVGGDKIKKVELVDDETTGWSSVSAGWADKDIWLNGLDEFLASFKGEKIEDVKKIKVECATSGQPNSVSGFEYVTGATQGSGRVILAIQNALGVEMNDLYYGSYKYENPWTAGAFYGAKVYVQVRDGKIQKVEMVDDETTGWTSVSGGWQDKDIWLNGRAAFLKRFEGKTASEIAAITVTCAESGQPNAVSGFEYVTGATQGSGRVILAVQDAMQYVK